MSYTVTASNNIKINLVPSNTVEEVLQNVLMIISTSQYTVPLDRGFGLPQRFIDKPIQVAQAILISEVFEAIEKYEPRAKIEKVSFLQSAEEAQSGKLIPQVEVSIIE